MLIEMLFDSVYLLSLSCLCISTADQPVYSLFAVLTPPVTKVTPLPPAATAAAKVTDIRPGKRTKWDKVEDRSGLPPLDAVAVARERAAAISGGGNLRPTSRK